MSVDGFECGGRPGEDDVPNMILPSSAADRLGIRFVASGGMTDGRMPSRGSWRILNNANVARLVEIKREICERLTIKDIRGQVAGVYPKVMIYCDMDAGAWRAPTRSVGSVFVSE